MNAGTRRDDADRRRPTAPRDFNAPLELLPVPGPGGATLPGTRGTTLQLYSIIP